MTAEEDPEKNFLLAKDVLIKAHPELHHYTSSAGVQGILKNRTVWASLYRDLNDSSEIEHFRTPLESRMSDRFEELLRAEQRQHFKIRRIVEKIGGLEATSRNLARDLVRSYYDTTFSQGSTFSCPPFIASFCTHASSPYEQKMDS